MKVLLDTHALLWWLSDDRRLTRRARSAIARSEVLVSVLSAWEIEIKRRMRRLDVNTNKVLEQVSATTDFSWLDVRPSHVATLATLPSHHGDPFDRMLAAQAIHERAKLVTNDRNLRAYDVEAIW